MRGSSRTAAWWRRSRPDRAGRVKLYCVDSFDAGTWSAAPPAGGAGATARRATSRGSSTRSCRTSGPTPPTTPRSSRPAARWARSTPSTSRFKRADLFPLALCFSGNYDPTTWHGWGERGRRGLLQQPGGYVANLHGDHLEWLRSRLSVLLVCGQGQWEDTTGSLESTPRMAAVLAARASGTSSIFGVRRAARLASWRAQLPTTCPASYRRPASSDYLVVHAATACAVRGWSEVVDAACGVGEQPGHAGLAGQRVGVISSRSTRNQPVPATSDRKRPLPARRRRPVSRTWAVRPHTHANRQSSAKP